MAIKGEFEKRWGTIDLLDILKYAEFGTGFIAEFTSVATREMLSKDVLRRRLLLVPFGLGTNMGIKRVAVTGKHGESEATLRRVRHLFVHRANMRAAPRKLVNATFAVRDEMWRGTGTPCTVGQDFDGLGDVPIGGGGADAEPGSELGVGMAAVQVREDE
ncbi:MULTISPECIES: Tn3 family transposase [unclassified Streptomyces]|uniref:Tn3 family transposase n=1 Tax=unclassified Streptomyces TaxID=2593676 RepID=UPI003697AE40